MQARSTIQVTTLMPTPAWGQCSSIFMAAVCAPRMGISHETLLGKALFPTCTPNLCREYDMHRVRYAMLTRSTHLIHGSPPTLPTESHDW